MPSNGAHLGLETAHSETYILDIVVIDTDNKSNKHMSSMTAVNGMARKKKQYLDACLERCKTFMPLVYPVDGVAEKEAMAFEKCIASLLAEK